MKFHSLKSLVVNLVKEQILQHVSAQEACGMQECSSLKRGHLHTGLKSTELGPHPDSFIRSVQNNQGLLAGELPSSGAARPWPHCRSHPRMILALVTLGQRRLLCSTCCPPSPLPLLGYFTAKVSPPRAPPGNKTRATWEPEPVSR